MKLSNYDVRFQDSDVRLWDSDVRLRNSGVRFQDSDVRFQDSYVRLHVSDVNFDGDKRSVARTYLTSRASITGNIVTCLHFNAVYSTQNSK